MLVLSAFTKVKVVLYIKNKRIYKIREVKISLYYYKKLITFISPKEYKDIA
jgi:hypothetical protein